MLEVAGWPGQQGASFSQPVLQSAGEPGRTQPCHTPACLGCDLVEITDSSAGSGGLRELAVHEGHFSTAVRALSADDHEIGDLAGSVVVDDELDVRVALVLLGCVGLDVDESLARWIG